MNINELKNCAIIGNYLIVDDRIINNVHNENELLLYEDDRIYKSLMDEKILQIGENYERHDNK